MNHLQLAKRAERVVWCYIARLWCFRVRCSEDVVSFVMDALDEREWGLRRLKEQMIYEYLTFVFVILSEYSEFSEKSVIFEEFQERVNQDLFDLYQHILRLDSKEREFWEPILAIIGNVLPRLRSLA